ncbi:MAG: hypothetical protein J5525_13150 [Lachnospiraceae bacterium]|nr:hypothetical protein [Lachnospiraceae bacterium]
MGSDRFTIADVVEIRGYNSLRGHSPKTNGNETYCDCPFCGDTRGKFSYNNKKNTYHCWKCGASGNSVKFFIETNYDYSKDYSGIDGSKNAIKDIFAAINGDSILQDFHRKEIAILKTKDDDVAIAADSVRDKTYRALLKKLRLKKEHNDNLLKRGLSQEIIYSLKFRSTPSYKETAGICKQLISEGCTLEGVPGFYKDKYGRWNLYIAGEGYLCPVFDGEHGYILGFQIRLDNPIEKSKYLWISSAGKPSGVSSGALTNYLPGKNDNILIVTEGILKSTIIWYLLKGEVTVIGVPGVNAKSSLRGVLDRYSYAYAYEAFDMDKYAVATTPKEQEKVDNLMKATKDLMSILEDEYGFKTHPLRWDFDPKTEKWNGNIKGLDDFLVEYKDTEKFLNYIITKGKKYTDMMKFFGSDLSKKE